MSYWIITPGTDELSNKQRGWINTREDIYTTERHYILIVDRATSTFRNGGIQKKVEVVPGGTYTLSTKLSMSKKYTMGIDETITSSVSNKLSSEIRQLSGGSVGAGATGISANLKSELEAKLGAELSTSFTESLRINRNLEFQVMKEMGESFTTPIPVAKSDVRQYLTLYLNLKEHIWDVYLYKTEIIELRYEKNWIWPDVRDTIRYEEIALKMPLFSITFYEPQETLSQTLQDYTPEIESENSFIINPLTSTYPSIKVDTVPSLEELARLAFPVTRKERSESLTYGKKSSPIKPANKGKIGMKKQAAPKKAAKKAAPKKAAKKAAPKKAAKKAAPKKAWKKAAAPKRAAKKAAPKKAAKKFAPKKKI